MLGAAVIVFREVLEAALIIAIVMGASRGVAARGRWILAGTIIGILGATVVAAFTGAIADALEGRGQELLNASVLLAAVLIVITSYSIHYTKLYEGNRKLYRPHGGPLSAMLCWQY